VAIKTWFVTGASSGFGRAVCEHALERGYNVVATVTLPPRKRSCHVLRSGFWLALDVTDTFHVGMPVGQARRAMGLRFLRGVSRGAEREQDPTDGFRNWSHFEPPSESEDSRSMLAHEGSRGSGQTAL
jgi:NAD(P)-dependent dehydrogenase (short-subunit alcohol dehydrogenase family)